MKSVTNLEYIIQESKLYNVMVQLLMIRMVNLNQKVDIGKYIGFIYRLTTSIAMPQGIWKIGDLHEFKTNVVNAWLNGVIDYKELEYWSKKF